MMLLFKVNDLVEDYVDCTLHYTCKSLAFIPKSFNYGTISLVIHLLARKGQEESNEFPS